MNFTRTLVSTMAAATVALTAGVSFAADNPLSNPAYKNRLQELQAKYFEMVKTMDANMDGRVSQLEFIMNHDPLSPEFKKRSAEFKEMLRSMDTDKDGEICLEEYMASANPLHPAHAKN